MQLHSCIDNLIIKVKYKKSGDRIIVEITCAKCHRTAKEEFTLRKIMFEEV